MINFREELKSDILPFWLNNAIDKENGGIYTQLDKNGEIYGTDKSVWFQGRALWVFSKAYNLIEKRPEYLDAAKCIYDFIGKCVDSDGRMYFTVTNDGKGLQKRRYYFSETFAAIGCAEYYKATGDKTALADAEKYFNVAYECYTGVRYNEPKVNPDNSKMKALSPVMIMLATSQVMRTLNNDNRDKYDAIAKKCVADILDGGFLTERALLESVTVDGEFANTPGGRVVNPGHSLEAAWFLMMEGIVSGDGRCLSAGKKIIDITLPLGIDEKNGGIIAFTDVLGKPPVQLEWDMKLWWPQCEALIALRMAYDLFGNETYKKTYDDLLAYTEKNFIDEDDGEWYGYLHFDNSPSTTLKGNIFKGPFHIPRLYMIMAEYDSGNGISKYAK